ncbi:hypothetical protein EMWEY_00041630 [Eimeria maxima]|uniref:Uncharacterized protein n=1 Tax=Eimeria maxima TaxID=5804 RepID=U6MBA5_EIMMA|nr:hypothetical protein EMWEY_00041630 [Eimeria maxima]CDJ61492.1 hypothetical protein EMWEY_00041630 [Eimeria maxima]
MSGSRLSLFFLSRCNLVLQGDQYSLFNRAVFEQEASRAKRINQKNRRGQDFLYLHEPPNQSEFSEFHSSPSSRKTRLSVSQSLAWVPIFEIAAYVLCLAAFPVGGNSILYRCGCSLWCGRYFLLWPPYIIR